MKKLRISVFGGSNAAPGSPAYEEAMNLGTYLGRAGYTVLTGGYIGVMEAVSRGASEAGAHVIGVTCSEIEQWRKAAPNRWMAEEMRFQTLHQRLWALVEHCDVGIAMPGGVGTLAEIAVMWNNLQIQILPPRPLILVGEGWRETFRVMLNLLADYIPPQDHRLMSFASNAQEAFAQIPRVIRDA